MPAPSDTGSTPTPPGWPGDDPTLPDELDALGVRPERAPRPAPGARSRRPPAAPAGAPPPEPGTAAPQAASAAIEPEAPPHAGRHPEASAHADRVRGLVPAGRVLVVLVATLLLAMLVNADVLVQRAEQRPLGPGRDRALAVWHPVQDVSHMLQLYRVRQAADWVAGNGHQHRGGSAAPSAAPAGAGRTATTGPSATPTAGATAPGAAPTLRTPTARAPLRLWVGGDSLAQVFGQSLVTQSQATGLVAPTLHYEISSGLSRPDFYDWPGALSDDVAHQQPEVVVILLGANDAQGLVLPGGDAVPTVSDPRWTAEYRRRVGALMDQLRARDRLVVWVGQPPMRDAGFDSRMRIVNAAYAAEAASRPWVVYLDAAPIVGDASGRFTDLLPGASGTPVDVRQPDGIHLTRAGGDRLAARVLAVVEDRAHLAPR